MDLYQAGMAPVVICAGGAGGDRLAAGRRWRAALPSRSWDFPRHAP